MRFFRRLHLAIRAFCLCLWYGDQPILEKDREFDGLRLEAATLRARLQEMCSRLVDLPKETRETVMFGYNREPDCEERLAALLNGSIAEYCQFERLREENARMFEMLSELSNRNQGMDLDEMLTRGYGPKSPEEMAAFIDGLRSIRKPPPWIDTTRHGEP